MVKNPAAVALGRLGGLKGGPARMAAMSAKERSALGRQAARARWAKQRDLEQIVKRVHEEQARLQPLLPDIDPHDLNLILFAIFRPSGQRRFFIRKHGAGYVF